MQTTDKLMEYIQDSPSPYHCLLYTSDAADEL